jgi:alpha-ketoglutarate-dependent 2,4-dichlorophenoxyacetate dioxygenase
MSLTFEPLHPLFAAEGLGIDLTDPLSPSDHQAIQAAITQYGVLVFRGQPLSDDEHAAFTRHFGAIDQGLNLAVDKKQRLTNTDVIDIANVDNDGQVFPADHARHVSLMANQLWHSDSSFKSPPAKYSVLSAVAIPDVGGDTEFADQRAAYDALPDELKAEIDGLVAEHYAFHTRDMLGGGEYTSEGKSRLPPVNWPLVHTIPESNRKSLFVGVHTREIEGMPTAPARVFLLDLLERATQREFVYRHTWTQHDLIMWDNRCTLHRGRRYNVTDRRELRRCTTEVELEHA